MWLARRSQSRQCDTDIPYLEGSHDPDMMPEVTPRFESF